MTFESQASFSNRSNVADRLRATFDFLDKVFPERSEILRNRTMIQSFATLAARLTTTGKIDGHERALRHYFDTFMEELSRQVTFGQEATDLDYLEFQKTVNSNVRRNAQIRNEILLRKLLVHDPHFVGILGVSVIAESALEKSLNDSGKRISILIQKKNEEFAREHGEDLFKATNKTASALQSIGTPIRNYSQYREWLDGMYFLFRESVGQRLGGNWPESFSDINALRTAERHDVDHGDRAKIVKKRRGFGKTFEKYAAATSPDTLAPEAFAVMQAKLLQAVERDMQALKCG